MNEKVKKFVGVMNDLVDSESNPLRSDVWRVPQLHDHRRELWAEMTQEEKRLALVMLGDRATSDAVLR